MSIFLRNDSLSITEADIALCTDINLLLDWKIKIDTDLANMTHQINNAKELARQTGQYADSGWFARIRIAKRFTGQMSQLIQNRVKKLRSEQHQHKVLTHDRAFVLICKAKLSKELFLEIAEEANELVQGV